MRPTTTSTPGWRPFEITLHKTLAAVERGRDKLRGQSEFDEEFADDGGPIPD